MSAHTRSLLAHLHRLAAPAAPDATLFSCWTEQRNQQAFAALMARHGPMVLGVCHRILGDVQEAEDVFQATFLVLARQTSPLRQPESLAGFLHTVARRLARKARAALRRRQRMQMNAQTPEPIDPQPPALDVLSGRELLALVDEEIGRLPEVYRLPVLLCLMQGRTIEEAARQLGWSIGSLRGRLTRGRERLRERLSRRGLDLSVGVVALLAPAAVPEKLLAEGVRHLTSPVPATVGTLAGGMMRALKLKIAGLAVILAAAIGLTAHLSMLRAPQPEMPAADSPVAPPAQAKDEPRHDRYGDPLPQGAIARLGTLRWRACGDVESLAFTPNGKMVVLSESERGDPPTNGLCLFDAANGKRLKTIRPAGTLFERIALSADGKRLAAVCTLWSDDDRNKTVVQIRELPSGRKVNEFAAKEFPARAFAWLGWSSDGQLLAAYVGKSDVVLRDLMTRRERRFPAKDLSKYSGCAVGKNVLAAIDENGHVHLWDRANGEERCVLKAEEGSYALSLALSANERWLAALTRDAAGAFSAPGGIRRRVRPCIVSQRTEITSTRSSSLLTATHLPPSTTGGRFISGTWPAAASAAGSRTTADPLAGPSPFRPTARRWPQRSASARRSISGMCPAGRGSANPKGMWIGRGALRFRLMANGWQPADGKSLFSSGTQ